MYALKRPTAEEVKKAWDVAIETEKGISGNTHRIPEICYEERFIARLLQTFPPVWEPVFSGFVIEKVFDDSKTAFMVVNILTEGVVKYPLLEITKTTKEPK